MNSIIYILNYNNIPWNYSYNKQALKVGGYFVYAPTYWSARYLKLTSFLKHTLLVFNLIKADQDRKNK